MTQGLEIRSDCFEGGPIGKTSTFSSFCSYALLIANDDKNSFSLKIIDYRLLHLLVFWAGSIRSHYAWLFTSQKQKAGMGTRGMGMRISPMLVSMDLKRI